MFGDFCRRVSTHSFSANAVRAVTYRTCVGVCTIKYYLVQSISSQQQQKTPTQCSAIGCCCTWFSSLIPSTYILRHILITAQDYIDPLGTVPNYLFSSESLPILLYFCLWRNIHFKRIFSRKIAKISDEKWKLITIKNEDETYSNISSHRLEKQIQWYSVFSESR